MAWIYLAESEDLHSHLVSGLDQLPIVKSIDTPKVYYCPECATAHFPEHRYGMTCEHSPQAQLEPSPTSSTADSPARTSALRVLAEAWRASEADFTLKSKDLSEKQRQLSSFLKTSLRSGHADLAVWCGDFPNSGMIVDGQLYLPQKLELRTSGSDGSFLLPTPSASSYGSNKGGAAGRVGKERHSLETMARKSLWPTPKAADSNPCGMQAMLRYNEKTGRKTLITEVAKTQVGGQLNPTWVEWLMGYPLGWTALEDWATLWFRSKRKSRLKD